MAVRDVVGTMRHLIEVQQDQSSTKLDSGEEVPDWQMVFTAWANIAPLTGREFWNAVQVQANVTHKITLRYRGDVPLTADMRLAVLPQKTRIFHLSGPPRNLDETGDFWECLAVETVTNPRT